MKIYFCTLIIIISAVSIYSVTKKQKTTGSPKFDVKHAGYEREHYNDYSLKQVFYEKWPELDREKRLQYCQKQLKKIFPKRSLNAIGAEVYQVRISYLHMQNSNGDRIVTKLLTSLQCKILTFSKNRKIFHFVRAPAPNCVYLVNHSQLTKGYYYINALICEHHSYKTLKKEGEFSIPGIRKQMIRARKTRDSPNQVEQYEWDHFKDYRIHIVSYERWPELDRDKQVQYCQKHLKKIFPKRTLNAIGAEIYHVRISYQHMQNNNRDRIVTKWLTGLRCKILIFSKDRRMFHFVRAPALNCVYLVNHSQLTKGLYCINAQICEHHSYKTLKREGEFGIPGIRKRIHLAERTLDSHKQLEQYEWDHFKDYRIHKAKYVEWPEVHDKDPSDYCSYQFRRILPRTAHSEVKPRYTTAKLIYKILAEKHMMVDLVRVATLACEWPQRYHNNIFQFIRAPKENCLYLIQPVTKMQTYHITKQLCEENEESEDEANYDEDEPYDGKGEPKKGEDGRKKYFKKSNMSKKETNMGEEEANMDDNESNKGEVELDPHEIEFNQQIEPNKFGIDAHQQTVELFSVNEKIPNYIEMGSTIDINSEFTSTDELLKEMFKNDESDSRFKKNIYI